MQTESEKNILEIARKHFVQKGFSGARMQEIADEANINKAMLHYYFRSKEKLYQAIIKETLDTIIPTIANAFLQEGSLFEKIENLVETYISTLIVYPELPFFIMSEISQRRQLFIKELKKRAIFFPAAQNFILQLTQEMKLGKIRKVDPGQLFLSIMGMTVFPFIAKPVYCTIFEFSESNFDTLMEDRTQFIMEFVKNALDPN